MDILDEKAITEGLRTMLRSVALSLEGENKVLALYLSRHIEVNKDMSINNPDHDKSLGYLDSVCGILSKFDEEAAGKVAEGLGL